MTQSVKIDIFYPYPPAKVWKVLTNRRALAAWLMENDFEPCLGHKFRFYADSLPGLPTKIECEVIEIEEPKRLVYTWREHPTVEPSLVVWTLTKREEGTQLQLRHLETSVAIAVPSATLATMPRQYKEKNNITSSGLFFFEMESDFYHKPISGLAAVKSSPRLFEWDYYLKQRLLDWLQQEHSER